MFRFMLFSALFLSSNIYSVQVFDCSPTQSSAGMMGQAFGQGMAMRMREQEIRNQNAIATRNNIYKLTMLRDYDPERHGEFVSCINRSALSYSEKLEVIFLFESAHKAYSSTKNK